MYTNQLINLLKTFTPKEMMWFGKFLNSPYFNNRGRIIKLFRILKRFYPEFEGRSFSKQSLHKLLYGKKKFNDSTFRNLMSDLLQLALQYLKQEGMEKVDIESSFFLTRELFNREAFDLFRNRMTYNKKILESEKVFSSDRLLNSYRIDTDSFYVNLLTQKVLKKSYVISESERLINGIVSIMNYFILETIKHNDNLLQYSRSYNIQKNVMTVSKFLNIFNFDKLIEYIKENSISNVPAVECYYKLLKAFTFFDDESYYFELKRSLTNCSKSLGINDNNFLHLRLIGYCVLKITQGKKSSFDINREIFQLYDIYVKNEFYKTETSKYLPFDTYRNVLLNCITVKELSYMEDFIKTYSKKLLPKQANSIENYSYALLYFEKHSFIKALNYLNKIKFDQFIYKLDMKNLQLKINYELEQFESAISVIDTYRHFLKNNVLISESRKTIHNNFLLYTSKLIQYRTGSQKISLPFILDKIEKSKNTFDKVWLMDKIKELSVVNIKSKAVSN